MLHVIISVQANEKINLLMKKYILLIILFGIIIQFNSCYIDRKNIVPDLNEWGLTGDISDIISDDIVEAMVDLGMPIYGGVNPPSFENASYFITPFILTASTRSQDELGEKYNDFTLTLSEYNLDDLTIMVRKESNSTISTGIGSFLVGEGDDFSIFTALYSVRDNGSKSASVRVISGTLTNTGIVNYYESLFLTDDFGDVNSDLIEIGDGRVFYDSDGFTPKI